MATDIPVTLKWQPQNRETMIKLMEEERRRGECGRGEEKLSGKKLGGYWCHPINSGAQNESFREQMASSVGF